MVDYATIRLVCAPSGARQYGVARRVIRAPANVWRHAVIADCQSDQSGTGFCVCFGPWHGGQRVAIASVVAQWSGFLFMIWYINRPGSHIGVGRFFEISLFLSAIRDRVAYRRFWFGADIFIRTALLVLCEAMVLNQAPSLAILTLPHASLC
ncbi:MAG: hypothetical protein CM15mP46_7370 [Alphaproteobacteria bacterium]|nr:MAG: hypothetical protein CM15mP46_7370 [Alphaproteobacteria bacterium]